MNFHLRRGRPQNEPKSGHHGSGMGKKTGQIWRREKSSVSDLELGSLARFFSAYLVQSVHALHSR
jgi:hypothetical protein